MTKSELLQLAYDQGKLDYKSHIICNPFVDNDLQEAWLRGYQSAREENKRDRNEKVKRF
jgi:hypothetical protein